MCGIVGFVDKKRQLSANERRSLMKNMLRDIDYRGRDASGIYENNGIVIGHNRLAILDRSKKANQPMSTESGDLVISYNGEIFNHLSIRDKNFEYKTNSDTETFLHAYKKHGKGVFGLIRGMFAVSFYKPTSNKIILSVDQFGIKPLYYINTNDWFAWSSELKVFKHLSAVNFELNKKCLFQYGIFRTIAGPETMLKNIYKLTPSAIIEYDFNKDYLTQDNHAIYYKINKKDSLGNLLAQSVSEHIMSNVPIGLQLSGGVDSSLISALAKKVLKQKDIHSFSIGLRDPKWNEFQYSREVSKLLKTKHHEIVFDQDSFCKNYPIATYHLDEPLAYPNTVPMMLLSNFASKYVKVLLSGEGADELFGGYNRYKKILSKNKSNLSILYSNSFSKKTMVLSFLKVHNTQIKYRENIIDSMSKKSTMQKLGTYDLQTFLPSLLLRQDKMGMASTIENRFPFLDPRLANFALNLSDSSKNNSTGGKIILKKFASRYLPKDIVFRKKCGFGLPISEWLRDSKGFGRYLSLLTNPRIKRAYLNYPKIIDCINEHLGERRDNSEIIWILLSLEVWAKIFIDGEKHYEIWPSLID